MMSIKLTQKYTSVLSFIDAGSRIEVVGVGGSSPMISIDIIFGLLFDFR